MAVTSFLCVLISALILTLNTMPSFQEKEDKIMGDYWVFAVVEGVCMVWFTFEFTMRLISCPNKCRFFMKVMNWIDMLSLIPYIVTVILFNYTSLGDENETLGGVDNAKDIRRVVQFLNLLRIVKTLRIIRIFKLARHSTGLQALGYTLKSNYRDLALLIVFLGMGAIMFSSLTFVFENDSPNSPIHTMLDAYWWAIITMTTVGYGDVFPISGLGMVVGTVASVFGVLVIGLPIPIIGSAFNNYYAREKRRERIEAEKSKMYEGLMHRLEHREP